jgi:hypothetical protein
MPTFTRTFALVAATAALAACADKQTTAPMFTAPSAELSKAAGANDGGRAFRIMDRCDPATFNAAVGDGTCQGDHTGITFDKFIAQLTRLQTVPEWLFAPGQVELKLGESFVATNDGGETHTFTEVEEFGGGMIDFLNQLAGTPIPAPECLNLAQADFIPPGGSRSDTPDAAGTEKYQCCIHPWMHATVHIRSK